jgi:hypothetical protein
MRDGGFISAHDFHISTLIAEVVCGGDVDAGSLVSEEYLMTLERKRFCALLDTPRRRNASWACCRPASPCATDRSETEHMSKQVQDAYIVAATRTPIGKSGRGYFKNTRPTTCWWRRQERASSRFPPGPEGHRRRHHRLRDARRRAGHERGRVATLLSGLPKTVAGATVNRFCAAVSPPCRWPLTASASAKPTS